MFNPWIQVYKDDVYNLKLSIDDGIACVHCLVTGRINRRNIEVIREAFKEMCFQLEDKGFKRIFAHTPTTKFAKLITGDTFHYVCDIMEQPFIYWEFEEFLYG